MKRLLALLGGAFCLISASPAPVALDLILGDTLPSKLSDFRFFESGNPNKRVKGYKLLMPLFSDYAEKQRFVFVPAGKAARYSADAVFDFPVGSALIKTFGFVMDQRAQANAIKPIETRVLLRRKTGWVALPYVWDDTGEATLLRSGRRVEVKTQLSDGTERKVNYAIPNVNQCKGCHDVKGVLTPIGPKARNLNDGNQLQHWKAAGILEGNPPHANMPTPWTAETRARAYLDINCGHCHNRAGPANTSGLWLDWNQPKDTNLGIYKRPTAAGRGSGDLSFAIVPGHPEQSYLITRMKSLDPGIAMPELGRSTVDEEGVAMVSQWIKEIK